MLELKNGCGFIRDLIKSFFSPVGGGRTSFASQNGNIQRKEDLRQEYNYSSSNSDFNRKRGEEYLISSSFTSENIIGGGQLRSNSRRLGCELASRPYSASSRSYKGGEGNYASLMSSRFADTKTMLNSAFECGGGGEIHWKRQLLECKQSLCSCVLASYTRNENDLQKGGNGYLVTPSFLYEGGVC